MNAGPELHVDMLVHEPTAQPVRFSYTSYMYEPFSATLMGTELTDNKHHVNLAIPINAEECMRIQSYLMCLVGSAAYNYKDLVLALGMLGHGTFMNTMCQDVDGSDPSKIKQVYCSQAAVLMMRNCLSADSNASLLKVINGMNSRDVTPHKLFETVKPYGKQCSGESLLTETLDFGTPQGMQNR